MKHCARCGDHRRLRYDRVGAQWLCVAACGTDTLHGGNLPKARRTRPALFNIWITEDGERRKATRRELAEAARLYYVHSDVRTGSVR